MRYKMNRKHFYIFFMVIGLIITNGFGTALGSQFNYSMKNQSSDDPSSFLVDSNLIFGTATWSDGGYAYGASVTVISIFGNLMGSVNENGEWSVNFSEYNEKWPDGTPFEVIISGCCPRWFWSGYSFGYINGDYNDLGNIVLIYRENFNHPPTIPFIDGSFSGNPGIEFIYTIESVDLESLDIYYCIDWGDNSGEICIGPFPSGEQQIVNHTWDKRGTYEIKIKSKDTYNAESDWSYPIEVSMSKNKINNFPHFLYRIIENYPNLFSLIRQILGL